ncbi:hypothetical protein YC2023_025783 [Brassica napus]
MALGVLDLLLVFDCAWIWVRSEIRELQEASMRWFVRRTTEDLCFFSSNDNFHGVPQRKVGFSSLLPSSTTGVLRTTLDVDVYCGNGEAFFLPSGHLLKRVPYSFCASFPVPKLPAVYVLAFFCVNLGFALSTSSSSGAPGREPGARLQVIQMLGATSVRFDRARLQVILLLAVSNQ